MAVRTDALGGGGPPTTVPDVDSLDLTYQEVADREAIGQGGNADVFRTTVRREGREIPVAVKQPRLQGTLQTDTVDRFVREADVWAELDDHDHIVSLCDWGGQPLPWLAMEYMNAGTLADLPNGERLPLDQALWTGACVCRAVHHAHRHGVAHHDIKPANVLFTSTGDGWAVPKVSDWGLARLMLKETGSVDGLSPHYAAPEQFDADTYGSPDDRTDIYRVRTLVYELVTGRPPFEGPATAVMQGVLSTDPSPPSQIADVPAELDEVLRPALAKEPDDRYDTIVYLRDGLQELFEQQHGDASVAQNSRSSGTAPPVGRTSTDESSRPEPSRASAESSPTDDGLEEDRTDVAEHQSAEDETQHASQHDDSADDERLPFGPGQVGIVAGLALVALLVGLSAGLVGLPFIDWDGDGGEGAVGVEFVDVPDEVVAGEEFDVTVEVENGGDAERLEVEVEELETDSEARDVGEESPTETFEFTAGEDDAGSEYTIRATIGEAEDETTVTVVEADDDEDDDEETAPAQADLSGLDIAGEGDEATVTEGEEGDISVDVENTGDEEKSFGVELEIDGEQFEENIGLEAGEEETVEFSDVIDLEPGTYDVTVSTEADEISGTVTVEESASFDASIVSDHDEPVDAGEGVVVAVELTSIEGDPDFIEVAVRTDFGSGTVTFDDPSEGDIEIVPLLTGSGDASDEPYTIEVTPEDDEADVKDGAEVTIQEPNDE